MTKAVILLSGGLDSTTLLYSLRAQGFEVEALMFNYGQRHNMRELSCAQATCASLEIGYQECQLPVQLFSKGSLSGSEPVPEGHYADENMKATIVPNRNAVLLAMAFAYAVTVDAQVVSCAVHAGDHPIYPDCRPEFLSAFEKMEALALGHDGINLLTPFQNLTKAEIVTLGSNLEVPYERTYSCYNGQSTHCGRCGTCVERKEAFRLAHISDPTTYESPGYLVDAYRG